MILCVLFFNLVVNLNKPMEETTTKLLFTSDSTQNLQTISDGIFMMSRKFQGELCWMQTSANSELTLALVGDLKKRTNRDLTVVEKSGDFWTSASKTANSIGVEMSIIFADIKPSGFLGGGMLSVISKFKAPVIYLSPGATFFEPKNILMLIDSHSECRQEFYRVSILAKMFFAKVHILPVSNKTDNDTIRYLNAYSNQAYDYMLEHGVMVSDLDVESGADIVSVVKRCVGNLPSCWLSTMNHTDGEGLFKTSPFQQICEQLSSPIMACAVHEVIGAGGSGY